MKIGGKFEDAGAKKLNKPNILLPPFKAVFTIELLQFQTYDSSIICEFADVCTAINSDVTVVYLASFIRFRKRDNYSATIFNDHIPKSYFCV